MKWIVILLAASMATSAFVDIALSDTLAVPATSKAELKAYLQANPEFPLNRLPPLAKQRFLANISFNENGLLRVSMAELKYAFSEAELLQIDALIGYKLSTHMKGMGDGRIRQDVLQVSPTVANSFHAFYLTAENLDIAEKDRAIQIAKKYNTLFSINPEYLATVKDGDLFLLFRAASFLDYEHSKIVVQDMMQIAHELEKRKLALEGHYSRIYDVLLAKKLFDRAREFAVHHNLEKLPEIIDAPGLTDKLPTILAVDPNKNQLLRKNINLTKTPTVLVIAHPFCQYCQDAVADIEADPKLRQLFKKHALWLSPESFYLKIDAFQKWNKNHPIATLSMAYSEEEWPGIEFWSTPRFYFLKEGKPIAKVVSWPDKGNKEALLKGMRKIGILPVNQ